MKKYLIDCKEVRTGTLFGGIYEGEDLGSCLKNLHEDFPFFEPVEDILAIELVLGDRRLRVI